MNDDPDGILYCMLSESASKWVGCGFVETASNEGRPSASIFDGRRWPDVVHVLDKECTHFISQRVYHDIVSAFGKGCLESAEEVHFDGSLGGRKVAAQPEPYFRVSGREEVAVRDTEEVHPFPVQFDYTTWTGCPMIRARNRSRFFLYVSSRVIDLAVSKKWTNARFHPSHIDIGPFADWQGIPNHRDWRRSFVPVPYSGSVNSALLRLFSESGGESYRGRLELFEMGSAAVGPLLIYFRNPDVVPGQKIRIAQVLSGLHAQGADVPSDILTEALKIAGDN